MKNKILNHIQIENIIQRIAYQIYECYHDESDIVIAGISKNGFIVADKICSCLRSISSININLGEVFIDKQNPRKQISTTFIDANYTNKCIVLVDDVLNTGSTLIYGVKFFLEVPLKDFKTVVLVDRSHKKYPVKVDFKGISLSTSINDIVVIEFNESSSSGYLI